MLLLRYKENGYYLLSVKDINVIVESNMDTSLLAHMNLRMILNDVSDHVVAEYYLSLYDG